MTIDTEEKNSTDRHYYEAPKLIVLDAGSTEVGANPDPTENALFMPS